MTPRCAIRFRSAASNWLARFKRRASSRANMRSLEALESRQVERLRALRQRRDKAAWESAIRGVEDAARTEANLMPHIIHAVESYCTVGEISDAFRRVFGEYQETVVI